MTSGRGEMTSGARELTSEAGEVTSGRRAVSSGVRGSEFRAQGNDFRAQVSELRIQESKQDGLLHQGDVVAAVGSDIRDHDAGRAEDPPHGRPIRSRPAPGRYQDRCDHQRSGFSPARLRGSGGGRSPTFHVTDEGGSLELRLRRASIELASSLARWSSCSPGPQLREGLAVTPGCWRREARLL